ncbi:MAG TPA: hypothetical protein VMA95_00760 [Streptosporangiaceae bacterium]|nr:hypothetical protein [Streptosporangiaceae bacterium]
MTNEVADLLAALHDGSMTTEEVAERFRERAWPRRQRPEPQNYKEMASQEMQDPDPYVSGSYDDVAAAYHRGELSDEQYSTLIEAIATSKQIEDDRHADGESSGR